MEEIDIQEIFKRLWNSRRFIITLTVIFMVIAAVYSYVIQTPKYQSYTTIVLTKAENTADENTSVTQTDVTMNQKLVSTYSEIVRSKTVLSQVISNLQIANLTESQLRSNVTVTAIEDTEVIKIMVSNENPEYAAKIANEIGKVFSEKIREMYKINNVYTLDEAEVSYTPYNIKHTKYIAIAMILGIVVACGIIIVRGLFDTTVKSAEEIEQALKIPVIAQLEFVDEVITKKGGRRK